MKEIICGIYKITSPSGRIYIGQSIDIYKRWYLHKYKTSNRNQTLIYSSLVKYGISNHFFEVIECCEKQYLNEEEIYWINFYKSNIRKHTDRNGLNLTSGGTSGTKRIKHILQFDLNNVFVKEWECIQDIVKELKFDKSGIRSCCQKKVNSANKYKWIYKGDSLDTNIKNIPYVRGNIIQYDKMMNIIKVWKSPKEASKFLSISLNKPERTIESGIYHNIAGRKSRTYLGYIWKSE